MTYKPFNSIWNNKIGDVKITSGDTEVVHVCTPVGRTWYDKKVRGHNKGWEPL